MKSKYELADLARKEYERASYYNGFPGWLEWRDAEEMVRMAKQYRSGAINEYTLATFQAKDETTEELVWIEQRKTWKLETIIRFLVAKDHYMTLQQTTKFIGHKPRIK